MDQTHWASMRCLMVTSTTLSRSKPEVRKREFPRFGDWFCFTSVEAGSCILELIASAIQQCGYDPKEVFGVRLALEEALVNAVNTATATIQLSAWGHRGMSARAAS